MRNDIRRFYDGDGDGDCDNREAPLAFLPSLLSNFTLRPLSGQENSLGQVRAGLSFGVRLPHSEKPCLFIRSSYLVKSQTHPPPLLPLVPKEHILMRSLRSSNTYLIISLTTRAHGGTPEWNPMIALGGTPKRCKKEPERNR